jgi:hypothetical protein
MPKENPSRAGPLSGPAGGSLSVFLPDFKNFPLLHSFCRGDQGNRLLLIGKPILLLNFLDLRLELELLDRHLFYSDIFGRRLFGAADIKSVDSDNTLVY